MTSSSVEHPVKDNHATVDIVDPTSTKDAPAVPSEEPSSDPINSTTADGNVTRVTLTITRVLTWICPSDTAAPPIATNDMNGDNQDTNMDDAAKKAKDQAQVDEGTQSIMRRSHLPFH